MRRSKRSLTAALALLLALLLAVSPVPAALATEGGLTDSQQETQEETQMDQEEPTEERHAQLSISMRNMVKRAYQLTDIRWVPLMDIEGWKGLPGNRFHAGQTYTGIPYGQPHRSGSYVPWQTSLQEYLWELEQPESFMYSDRAISQIKLNEAPYLSCECSAFVSWAWGLKTKETTHTLGRYGTLVGNRMTDLQVGDCLLKEGKHCRLVTDMTFDAQNNISGIEIAEETPPAARRIWYRANSETLPLSALQTEYLDKGYVIVRCNTREEIGYTHSCAVPLEGDLCPLCGLNPYQDLDLTKWYAPGVAFVCNQGIMVGTGEKTFSPGAPVTRAMMIAILWRMYYCPAADGTIPFQDVKISAFYYDALRWAYSKGYAAGTSQDTFSPSQTCSRAQIVTFLWNAAGCPEPSQQTCPFSDVKESSYYYKAVLWANEQGIVSGKTAELFKPKDTATRAEVAVIVWRTCQTLDLRP